MPTKDIANHEYGYESGSVEVTIYRRDGYVWVKSVSFDSKGDEIQSHYEQVSNTTKQRETLQKTINTAKKKAERDIDFVDEVESAVDEVAI